MKQTLISVPELLPLIESGGCVVIDCRFSLAEPKLGHQQYLEGHIPGAFYADLDTNLSSPTTPVSGRHPLPDIDEFGVFLSACGVTATTQVVVYDDNNGFFAARLWWLLRAVGHNNVALLNGNFQAWSAAEHVVESRVPENRAMDSRESRSISFEDGSACDIEALQTVLQIEQAMLVDARAPERYAGTEEPIDPVAGHIPGAVNLPITDNLDAHGLFISPTALRQRYASTIGQFAPQNVVHMCGSGVFACHAILAMEVAGLSGSKLYPGSWSEWIRDSTRPVATGEVP